MVIFYWLKSRNFNFRAYIWSHHPHFPWKFKSWAGKLLKIWGSNPRSGKSKKFCPFFFSFSNSSCKIGYLGDLNLRFSVVFPPMIWIFMGSEEDEIKSKQGSKKVRTLIFVLYLVPSFVIIYFKRAWTISGRMEYYRREL